MDKNIYFDNSATTPVRKEVVDEMLPFFTTYFGNPGSPHSVGQKARAAIDKARLIISEYFNTLPQEILFTSGGSESNNWALGRGGKRFPSSKRHIISSNIEHSSTLKTLKALEEEGEEVTYLPADKTGHLDLEILKSSIKKNTSLISLSFANSEIGTIFPIKEIGEICKEKDIPFHIDALQAAKYLPLDVNELNASYLSIGAHKIYGPKGIGMLYVRKGEEISPLISGGSQEYDLRAGTENVPAVVGFSKAVELLKNEREARAKTVKALRDYLEKKIIDEIEDTFVNGSEPRLPNVTNITFKGVASDALIYRLDSYGIYVSAGSACTSGSLLPSEVLLGIGLSSEYAKQSIRFSLSENNTVEEIDYAVNVIKNSVKEIRMV